MWATLAQLHREAAHNDLNNSTQQIFLAYRYYNIKMVLIKGPRIQKVWYYFSHIITAIV